MGWTLFAEYMERSCLSGDRVCRASPTTAPKFMCQWQYHLEAVNKILLFLTLIFQFSSVAQSCPTLCDPMNLSTPDLTVHHQLPECTQTHVHRVCDAVPSSHPLLSPSPPAFNLSRHQGLFQSVSSSHQVAKVWEFQLHHQSFQ